MVRSLSGFLFKAPWQVYQKKKSKFSIHKYLHKDENYKEPTSLYGENIYWKMINKPINVGVSP